MRAPSPPFLRVQAIVKAAFQTSNGVHLTTYLWGLIYVMAVGVPPFLKIRHNDVWGNSACSKQRGMIHYIDIER